MGEFVATLKDVDLTGLADGDTLIWDATARQWKRGAGGGFDPNADPVLIGDSTSADYPFCVNIGRFSQSDFSAHNATALGALSSVHADNGMALGYNASANHVSSVAIGDDVTTFKDNQILLGSGLHFAEINGDSSVAPNGLVLTDTDGTGNRWIIQINAGAITLNAAP